MDKTFSEVFGSLGLKNDTLKMFGDIIISRVVLANGRRLMKVYIMYDRLIPKRDIISLENELLTKLRMQGITKVSILEKYNLPDNYTFKIWFDRYFESIGVELSEFDNILYSMYKDSDFTGHEDGTISIVIPDNIIFKKREIEFCDYISTIAHDRFGYDIHIVTDYKEPKESKYRKEQEHKSELFIRKLSGKDTNEDDDTRPNTIVTDDGVIIDAETGEVLSEPAVADNASVENAGVGTSDASKASEVAKAADESKADNAADHNSDKNPDKKEASSKKAASSDNPYEGKYRKAGKGYSGNKVKGGGDGFAGKMVKSDNEDVLYNKDFEGTHVDLCDVQEEMTEPIIIRGQIVSLDEKYIERVDKTIFKIEISDFTDSLKIKFFLSTEYLNELKGKLKVGDFITAMGVVQMDIRFDHELEMSSVTGIKKYSDWRVKRQDNSIEKRVELHLHTKMSDSDGVSEISEVIATAKRFGHKAVAITDHGNVQAFPVANHCVKPGEDFKIIYGCEGYLVNDMQEPATNVKDQDFSGDFVVFDIETTGFSYTDDRIIEIGAVKISGSKIVGRFSEFVNPLVPIPLKIEKLTSIDDSMVAGADTIDVVLPRFLEFCEGSVLVAHNANFDVSFIRANCQRLGLDYDFTHVDTMGISRFIYSDQKAHSLDALCKRMKLVNEHHHRAVDDAEVTSKIFLNMITMLYEREIYNLKDLVEKGKLPPSAIARLYMYHIILIAKNEVGRRNLYTLVSESNVKYFNVRPKIPKSLIMKYREGLIIGSACERGELYSAIVEGKDDATISEIVDFYDYLEIQPLGNNMFQIESDKFENINSVEDIKNVNRRIIELGKAYNKPVCATCDAHFIDPEDAIYRSIILASKKMVDEEAPMLYYRTTEEMLAEFEYLGSDMAYEVVIKNTNLIADMCEWITPVRPDKAPPVIEDSDKTLRKICYNKAHEMYGDPLPEIVEQRLERELNSIIGNGYAVMYIIAQKLVWKSMEDGYLVGSRGSVGSSFVATMAGITEVNPLSPHYYCTNCFYNDFYSDEVKKYAGTAGCDMPRKDCPNCGKPLFKDGFDIPFETFLGFKGDKEPDIDLNFSNEYQSKAHKYTEVIFGAGQTFRAGTISGVAEETAYGLVKHYFDDIGESKRDGEIARIKKGVIGVKKTTGQHPGGIVVLPVGEDINSFTPLQVPADKVDETDTVTTHFEYHSYDHNLLKLDILGHLDPTMIRCLQDITGIDPLEIPLDDPQVMSLFQNLDALNLTPDQISGVPLGCLGIPEFGTDNAIKMLLDTKPTSFSDLVRISGLSHGTNVYQNNAEILIREGTATISTCVCTRDDIMTYLIGMGVDPALSFNIMEAVRKGKVAKGKEKSWPDWKEEMKAHNVPDWYIWSCERIEYMFPKAHAAAYVMMAWRVAYCKINYPLAYYCAFYSIRAKSFSYEKMCMGRAVLEQELDALRKMKEKKTAKEEGLMKDMRIVQEMYARGFTFMPLDLYRAKATYFQVIDGQIMPSFTAVDGLGKSAAIMLEEAAKDGPFLSKDDIKQRAKVGQSVIDKLTQLGILEGLPDTNQLSIFDFMAH